MKNLLLLLILAYWPAWSDESEVHRTYPAKFDPITQTLAPPRIPSGDLINGQRYRAVIVEKSPDGSITTNRFLDFTYNGPTHPPGFVNPTLHATDVYQSPELPQTRIYSAGPNGTPTVVNDQPWVGGMGIDRTGNLCMTAPGHYGPCGNSGSMITAGENVYSDPKSAEFGIVVPPYAPPYAPNGEPQKQKADPQPSPDKDSKLGPSLGKAARQFGQNLIIDMMRAFQETPEDRKQREEFEKRQSEILKRQQELEIEIGNKKVESAAAIARVLTLFHDSSSVRPSVTDVQNRINHARQHGDPSFRRLLNQSKSPTPADLTAFIGQYGKDAKDFLTTRYKLASQAEAIYILTHNGYDSSGQPVSPGKLLGITFNTIDTLTDPAKIYLVAKGVQTGAPIAARILTATVPKIVESEASLAAVALYSQELGDRANATDYVKDAGLRNAASLFFNGHDADNDNLAMNAVAEKYAAWTDPHIQLEQNAKAKEVYDFVDDWLQRNRFNSKINPFDQTMAEVIHAKLKAALEIQLSESQP